MAASQLLAGKRVVVTRPRHQAQWLGELLRAAGAEVIPLPLIAIADPPSWDALDAAIRRLDAGEYDWVAFTNANAVEKVFARLDAAPVDRSVLAGVKVAAVRRSTAVSLSRPSGLRSRNAQSNSRVVSGWEAHSLHPDQAPYRRTADDHNRQ